MTPHSTNGTARATGGIEGLCQKKGHIVIVGGSLSGLMAGVALKSLGHDITIVERNRTNLLENHGSGIVASGHTQDFFATYDRTRTPIAAESPFRQYLDKSGAQVSREDWMQRMTSWDLLYNILRANFDGPDQVYIRPPEKRESDGIATYVYGAKVTDIQEGLDSGLMVGVTSTNGEPKEDLIADLVIGADGPSSSIRKQFEPDIDRTYVGYCAWRGAVPETELSPNTSDMMVGKFTFYHNVGTQILGYVIPGEQGALEVGKRPMSWCWYRNAETREQKARFLTDSDGVEHQTTIPVGKINKDALIEARKVARDVLPPQFAELVDKTDQPFVQAITDVLSPGCVYLDEQIFLVGDAVAGFRPHTAASTGQAAYDVMGLMEVLEGKMTVAEWEERTMDYARKTQKHGVNIGERSQFGDHPHGKTQDAIAERLSKVVQR